VYYVFSVLIASSLLLLLSHKNMGFQHRTHCAPLPRILVHACGCGSVLLCQCCNALFFQFCGWCHVFYSRRYDNV